MTAKKPQQERSRFTFDSILDATMDVLNRLGGKKLTTREIAERAGVSIGSLYQYFKGTESILGEVLRKRIAKDIEESWAQFEATRGVELEERLRLLFVRIFEIHLPQGPARAFLFERVHSLKLVSYARDEIEGLVNRIYIELRENGEIRPDIDEENALYLASRAIFGVTMSLTVEYESMKYRADGLARELARLVGGYFNVPRV